MGYPEFADKVVEGELSIAAALECQKFLNMSAENLTVLDVELNISRAIITKKIFDDRREAPRDDAVRDLERPHRLVGNP